MKHLITSILLTLVSQVTFAQSALNAIQLDGVNDYVSANLPTVFNDISENDFTIEVWVKPQAANFSRIVCAQNNNMNFTAISFGVSNEIYFYVVKNGTTYSLQTANNLTLNTWTHVAASWVASSSQIQVYFDGVLQTGVNGGIASNGSVNELSIGASPGGTQFFNGSVDELRIWSEARSTCEIQANFDSELAGTETNLSVYYNFNQGIADGSNAGVTTLPELVSANNGTLINFALTGNTSNWTTSGASLVTSGLITTDVFYSFQQEICNEAEYDFNGQVLTASGTYTDTLQTFAGCDSIVELSLTVRPPSTSTTSLTSCGPYIWPLTGLTYNFSGQYRDTVPNSHGCDSIVTLSVLIWNVPSATIIDNGDGTYFSNEDGILQWIDCITDSVVGSGHTFAPAQNGSYALAVMDGVTWCTDTSDCFVLDNLALEMLNLMQLNLYPNPTNDQVHISFSGSGAELTVYDVQGKVVLKDRIQNQEVISLQNFERGVYLFDFSNSNGHSVQRVVKQ
jgi:hypothetical protein